MLVPARKKTRLRPPEQVGQLACVSRTSPPTSRIPSWSSGRRQQLVERPAEHRDLVPAARRAPGRRGSRSARHRLRGACSWAQSSLVPTMSVARILHVVPHPGGGGETYIRYLESMGDVRFESLPLTEHGRPHETPAGPASAPAGDRRLRPGPHPRRLGGARLPAGHAAAAGRDHAERGAPRPPQRRGARAGGEAGSAVGLRALRRRDRGVRIRARPRALARAPGRRADRPGPQRRAASASSRARPTGAPTRERLGHRAGRGDRPVRRRAHRAQAAAAVRGGGRGGAGRAPGDRRARARRGPAAAAGSSRCSRTASACSATGPTSPSWSARPTSSCLPSLWEGMAYAVLEAMALGRALLVSDGPGNPDAVGDAGLVFPAGDVPGDVGGARHGSPPTPALRASLGEAAGAPSPRALLRGGDGAGDQGGLRVAPSAASSADEDRDRLRLPLPEHGGRGGALVPQPRRAARWRARGHLPDPTAVGRGGPADLVPDARRLSRRRALHGLGSPPDLAAASASGSGSSGICSATAAATTPSTPPPSPTSPCSAPGWRCG